MELSNQRKKYPGLRQHQAIANSKPSIQCEQAIVEWYEAVKSGQLGINFENLRGARKERISANGGSYHRHDSRKPLYDASNEEACHAAWHEYSKLFDKETRSAGPFGLTKLLSNLIQQHLGEQ